MIETGEDAVLGQKAFDHSRDMRLMQLDASGRRHVAVAGVAVEVSSRCCTGVFASARLVGMPLRQASC